MPRKAWKVDVDLVLLVAATEGEARFRVNPEKAIERERLEWLGMPMEEFRMKMMIVYDCCSIVLPRNVDVLDATTSAKKVRKEAWKEPRRLLYLVLVRPLPPPLLVE